MSVCAGTPFIARAGMLDRVIDPRATLRMASLLEEAGAVWTDSKAEGGAERRAVGWDATVTVLAGKEHCALCEIRARTVVPNGRARGVAWPDCADLSLAGWWDTKEENDGGVMDDAQMRRFWKRVSTIANRTNGAPLPSTNPLDERSRAKPCAKSCAPALAMAGTRRGGRRQRRGQQHWCTFIVQPRAVQLLQSATTRSNPQHPTTSRAVQLLQPCVVRQSSGDSYPAETTAWRTARQLRSALHRRRQRRRRRQ